MKKDEIEVDKNGCLSTKNAKTLNRYIELVSEDVTKDIQGIFFALTDEDFESGKKKAGIEEGEKVYRICDLGFASEEGRNMLHTRIKERNEKIRTECSAQEAYLYEYNNKECMYSPEGDYDAIATIKTIFGIEAAKEISRVNDYYPVEDIKG